MSYCVIPPLCGVYYVPAILSSPSESISPIWLPYVSLSTNSTLYDTASRTVLTQTFVNPSKTKAIDAAKYNFPLYESCAVVAFRCFIGKRLIEGVVKEKHEAKVEYKQAVERGETAGLLEQQSPDVFTTSLGNIPAGETIKVEVEYIMELKHDAEADALRFTIPTSIAPRYGDAPSGLDVYADGKPIPGAEEKGGMKISVQVTMPSNIRTLSSSSHQLEIHLGGHTPNAPDDAFNPKQALATLSQTSAELGADFVLLVKCADLSLPRALVEAHPTIPNSKALMVTLVPKFTLPTGPRPEIVFVVDRSGSMYGRIEPVKSALTVFLKSLPVGVKFNICSFGSDYSFLWKKSQAYSAETLEQAQKHVDSMDADMGGTEILAPIKATVSARYKDLSLEIMVLTDGEVWNTEELFGYVEKQTAVGDIRLFSLGIGMDVSHALVEGLARVGRGFAQIVSDEKEGIEGKVVRMLRGGLSVHINNYRLEWEDKPNEKEVQKSAPSALETSKKTQKKKISLFDTKADADSPISKPSADQYAHLPEFIVPTVIQAPYKIPPLFPFSRTTAYVLISGEDVPVPSSVWLRGTTPLGDELELEIAVQAVQERAQTIHQLAARKVLQELEEGTGYLHSGNYGVNKEKNEGTFGDWVSREGTRIGVKYGVASKWTSFVAVEKQKKKGKGKEKEKDTMTEKEKEKEGKIVDDNDDEYEIVDEVLPPYSAPGEPLLQPQPVVVGVNSTPYPLPPMVPPLPRVGSSGGVAYVRSYDPTIEDVVAHEACLSLQPQLHSATGMADVKREQSKVALSPRASPGILTKMKRMMSSSQAQALAAPPPMTDAPTSTTRRFSSSFGKMGKKMSPSRYDSSQPSPPSFDKLSESKPGSQSASDRGKNTVLQGEGLSLTTPRDCTKMLIALQTFEGFFSLTSAFASILGLPLVDLEAKLSRVSPLMGLEEERRRILATVLAVWMFENKWAGERDVWELVVEKSRQWIRGLDKVADTDVKALEKLAAEVLGGL